MFFPFGRSHSSSLKSLEFFMCNKFLTENYIFAYVSREFTEYLYLLQKCNYYFSLFLYFFFLMEVKLEKTYQLISQ